MTTLVQMNTRIDGNLKTSGDAVFTAIGYSPTYVVRAVWEFAQRHQNEPDVVKRALDELMEHSDDVESRRKARQQKVKELERERQALCTQFGVDVHTFGVSTNNANSNQSLHELSLDARAEKHGM